MEQLNNDVYELNKILSKPRISKKQKSKAQMYLLNIEREIEIIGLIRKYITGVSKIEPKKTSYDLNSLSNFYSYTYEFRQKQANDYACKVITNWLKENIDKEDLRKWLKKN